MKINIITLFPEAIESYLDASILGRAQTSGAASYELQNLRDYSKRTHKNVDDTPYGGGAGMVMQVEPVHCAVEAAKIPDVKSRVILMSAKGKRYTQEDAQRLKGYDQLIFVCGRYEGVDERVAEHIADEEISIGDYVLTGGELGALVITDSVIRLLPGVLGNDDSSVYESHMSPGYKEHPHYTKPALYNEWSVPEVLLSGDHERIDRWRTDQATPSQ